jgi:predicted RNA-binding Zn-ribbon protein involved in translation (DUF1610 family)
MTTNYRFKCPKCGGRSCSEETKGVTRLTEIDYVYIEEDGNADIIYDSESTHSEKDSTWSYSCEGCGAVIAKSMEEFIEWMKDLNQTE